MAVARPRHRDPGRCLIERPDDRPGCLGAAAEIVHGSGSHEVLSDHQRHGRRERVAAVRLGERDAVGERQCNGLLAAGRHGLLDVAHDALIDRDTVTRGRRLVDAEAKLDPERGEGSPILWRDDGQAVVPLPRR